MKKLLSLFLIISLVFTSFAVSLPSFAEEQEVSESMSSEGSISDQKNTTTFINEVLIETPDEEDSTKDINSFDQSKIFEEWDKMPPEEQAALRKELAYESYSYMDEIEIATGPGDKDTYFVPLFDSHMDTDTGTLTIFGKGILKDFSAVPKQTSKSLVRKIIIGEGITGIYDGFSEFDGLKEVSFPKSLDYIYNSFKDCPSLQTVTFQKSPDWIESTSFDGGRALKDIVCEDTRYQQSSFINAFFKKESIQFSFEEETGTLTISGFGVVQDKFPREFRDTYADCWYSVKHQSDSTVQILKIEEGILGIHNSFNDLQNLKKVSLPSTLSFVVAAFNGCDQLKELRFPSPNLHIAECGKDSQLETLIFEGAVQIGGKNTVACFESDVLKTLYIPDGSYIYEDAFSFPNIETVVIGGPSTRFLEMVTRSRGVLNTNIKTTVYCYETQKHAFTFKESSEEKESDKKGYDIHLLANDEHMTLETALQKECSEDNEVDQEPLEELKNDMNESDMFKEMFEKKYGNIMPYVYWSGVVLFAALVVGGVFYFKKKKEK